MKYLFIPLFLIVNSFCFSQQISGTAFYTYKKAIELDDSYTKEEKRKRPSRIYEKEMILDFSNSLSTYKERPSLRMQENTAYRSGFLNASGQFITNEIFKISTESPFVEQCEFQGKLFLIKDTLPSQEWRLTKESKEIVEFSVFKAKKTISTAEEEIEVRTWFTPQIPVNNGPELYGGLAGLILEINYGDAIIRCNKLTLTKKQITIKPPKRGEVVTLKFFNNIVSAKQQELKEKYKN